MRFLQEHQINDRIGLLDEAWRAEESLVLLPDKGSVDAAWAADKLTALPRQLEVGHFVMLTSGSTGKPKLIIGNKARSERLARTLHEVQLSEPVRRCVLTLPLTYTYSFVNQWLWSRVLSRELVQTAGLSRPDELRSALQAARNAMLCLVGVQVPLLDELLGSNVFDGVIRVHFAGGRFPQEKLDVVRRLFPNARIFNNYGCAEAMPRLTVRPAEQSDVAANIGRPIPGVELRVDDGEALQFRSVYGAVGVVEDATGFTPITPETWVPTGDMGKANDDGSWQLLGRASEVFKRYGEKISLPSLLTTVLERWKGQAAFYRETDPRGEEGHVLVLSPAPDDAQVRGLLRLLASKHPRTHWPVRVESMERLPTLSSGKVDNLQLKSADGKKSHWHQRM